MTLQNKIYFIAGIGTDIGKSFLVENLCKILPNSAAIKPIASGFDIIDENSDSARILKALNCEISSQNIKKITPWHFKDPISPHFAAKNENSTISFEQVVDFCQKQIAQAKKQDKFLFIEAAGGVMTPINDSKTFLDLAAQLQVSTLLLTANYLGSISHSLTAVKALESQNIAIEKIIVNDGLDDNLEALPSITDSLNNFTNIKTVLLSQFLTNIKKIND